MTKKQDVQHIAHSVAVGLVEANVRYLNKHVSGKEGFKLSDPLTIAIRAMVITLVQQAFADSPHSYEDTRRSLGNAKFEIQTAVADGFTEGTREFMSESLDYSCEIAIFPTPANKELC